MVRLNLVVEGSTEETFVKKVLSEHLSSFNIFLTPRLVMTKQCGKTGTIRRGGITRYEIAARDITKWLKQDKSPDCFVTTMIDLYGLPKDFPGMDEIVPGMTPLEKVELLEFRLAEDVQQRMGESFNPARFIPYFQLHEFEALVFADPGKLRIEFLGQDSAIGRLEKMAAEFECPEDINDDPMNAPSKRIIRELPSYGDIKSAAGPIVAGSIGLPKLRSSCPHFNQWVGKIEKLAALR